MSHFTAQRLSSDCQFSLGRERDTAVRAAHLSAASLFPVSEHCFAFPKYICFHHTFLNSDSISNPCNHISLHPSTYPPTLPSLLFKNDSIPVYQPYHPDIIYFTRTLFAFLPSPSTKSFSPVNIPNTGTATASTPLSINTALSP